MTDRRSELDGYCRLRIELAVRKIPKARGTRRCFLLPRARCSCPPPPHRRRRLRPPASLPLFSSCFFPISLFFFCLIWQLLRTLRSRPGQRPRDHGKRSASLTINPLVLTHPPPLPLASPPSLRPTFFALTPSSDPSSSDQVVISSNNHIAAVKLLPKHGYLHVIRWHRDIRR